MKNNLTELPTYFIIERDLSNPLWQKYIDWLNETYHSNLVGQYLYYGYDGGLFQNGLNFYNNISDFKNNPVLITLEDWSRLVNKEVKKPLLELPKYFIIERDLTNPLWQKYIDWLNETYHSNWPGYKFLYYGNDGNIFYNGGTIAGDIIEYFKNNPVLITLNDWDRLVNKKVESSLTELPTYFMIERDLTNPLWKKYIDWLNKTYHTNWSGEQFLYYGYGYSLHDRTDSSNESRVFKNNAMLITLEDWYRLVNKEMVKSLTELPEYFIVKKDLTNPLWQKYIDWLNETYHSNWVGKYLYYGYDGSLFQNGANFYDNIFNFENNPVLITLEDWYRLSKLPKDKKGLWGYKLKPSFKKYKKQAMAICGISKKKSELLFDLATNTYVNIKKKSKVKFKLNSKAYFNAKEAQILDIWFDPVYKYVK